MSILQRNVQYDQLDTVRTRTASGWPYISLLILTFLNHCISVKTSLINTKREESLCALSDYVDQQLVIFLFLILFPYITLLIYNTVNIFRINSSYSHFLIFIYIIV